MYPFICLYLAYPFSMSTKHSIIAFSMSHYTGRSLLFDMMSSVDVLHTFRLASAPGGLEGIFIRRISSSAMRQSSSPLPIWIDLGRGAVTSVILSKWGVITSLLRLKPLRMHKVHTQLIRLVHVSWRYITYDCAPISQICYIGLESNTNDHPCSIGYHG